MNTQSAPPNVTRLLVDWGNGDQAALEKLMPLVYKELQKLAHQYLRKERGGNTFMTTDLVHEAYLKLVNQHSVRWENRAHFFGVAAQLMRRILVDRVRHKKRKKRGEGVHPLSLDEAMTISPTPLFDMCAFDEALTQLAGFDQRKARIVELRFFGGLSVEETAQFLNISGVTVMRDWKVAKAWLHKTLSSEGTASGLQPQRLEFSPQARKAKPGKPNNDSAERQSSR